MELILLVALKYCGNNVAVKLLHQKHCSNYRMSLMSPLNMLYLKNIGVLLLFLHYTLVGCFLPLSDSVYNKKPYFFYILY